MRRLPISALLLLPVILALEYSSATAQADAHRSIVASGGVDAANSTLDIAGTLGQSIIGPAATLSRTAWQGFWYVQADAVSTTVPVPGNPQASVDCLPNPIARSANVRVTFPETGPAVLALHDLLGRTVKTLHDGIHESGAFTFVLNTDGIPVGRYTLNLSNGKDHSTLPVVIVR